MALTEIIFTHTFYNIYEVCRSGLVYRWTSYQLRQNYSRLPEGYYEKPSDLLLAMKDKIRAQSPLAHECITLRIDSYSRRCIVKLTDKA